MSGGRILQAEAHIRARHDQRQWVRVNGVLVPIIRGAATGVAFTNFLEQKLLEHAFRATDYAEPATVYLGLFTAAPGDAGGGTEVTGGSYARQSVTFGAYAAGVIQNSGTITFPTATADWGNITDVAIFDAVSAGNMMAYGTLLAAKNVKNGDTFTHASGKLTVGLD